MAASLRCSRSTGTYCFENAWLPSSSSAPVIGTQTYWGSPLAMLSRISCGNRPLALPFSIASFASLLTAPRGRPPLFSDWLRELLRLGCSAPGGGMVCIVFYLGGY